MRRFVYLCMLFLLFLIPVQMVSALGNTTKASPVNLSLINSLRQGGYVLYVRHGEATVGEDQPGFVLSDCSTQRNLSEEGKRQALLFGQTIRRLQIPIETPVQASPFCRTRESAELAFGVGNVQVDPFWVNIYNLSGNVTPADRDRTLAALNSKLEKVPSSGTNKIIIAHSFPPGVGLGEIPYAGTVVVKPRGEGAGYDVIDSISLEELMSLQ